MLGFGNNQFNNYGRGSNNGVTDFMNSNSLVAKVVFLLSVVFIFIILLRISVNLIHWSFSSNKSPHLINGMVDGKQMIIIPQDPATSGSKTIIRSINGPEGIEFTWSCWIYIDDLQYLSGKYRHIFHKGNDEIDATSGLNFPNNAPGLYISPNSNELTIIMNTFDVINEEIKIPNIPLNKWLNVIIRCRNKDLDVYINGIITKSIKLSGVPKQNYGNVYVGMNGGFSGYVSDLWYYDYALGTTNMKKILVKGPNLKFSGENAKISQNPNYLSLRWYFYGDN